MEREGKGQGRGHRVFKMLRSSRQRLSAPNGVVKVGEKNSIGCQFSMQGSVTAQRKATGL